MKAKEINDQIDLFRCCERATVRSRHVKEQNEKEKKTRDDDDKVKTTTTTNVV